MFAYPGCAGYSLKDFDMIGEDVSKGIKFVSSTAFVVALSFL